MTLYEQLGSPPVSTVHGATITLASDVATEETEWLWEGYIPFGKLTIVDGWPGQGKSTLTSWLVAAASTASDPLTITEPASSVLLSAEDGLEDTIVPRLIAHDAELKRVSVLEDMGGRGWVLPRDLRALEDVLGATGAKIVVIDPLMAYLEESVNANSDQSIRAALRPVTSLAARTGVAVLAVRHLRKNSGEGGPAMAQGGGSIGIVGAARVGLLIAGDPHDISGDRKVMSVSKMNCGLPGPSLAFHLEDTGPCARLVWEGASDHSAETLLANVDRTELEQVAIAGELLRRLLTAGPMAAKEVLETMHASAISDKHTSRAKRMLGLRSKLIGETVYWEI